MLTHKQKREPAQWEQGEGRRRGCSAVSLNRAIDIVTRLEQLSRKLQLTGAAEHLATHRDDVRWQFTSHFRRSQNLNRVHLKALKLSSFINSAGATHHWNNWNVSFCIIINI